MKQIHHALILLLLATLGLVSCQEEDRPSPSPDHFEIALPETVGNASIGGLESGIGYYLNEDLLVDVTITQGKGKTLTIEGLPITSVSADGSKGVVTLPESQLSQIDRRRTYDLTASLRNPSGVTAASITRSEQNTPFDLLSYLSVRMAGASRVVGSGTVSVKLSSEGNLFPLRLGNTSKESIPLETLSLTGKSGSETVTFADKTMLPPEEQTKVIAFLAHKPDEQVALSINGVAADAEISTTGSLDKLPTAVFTAADKLSTDRADELLPEEKANTISGGDPDFSFNDITFWVGEGSKTSAFVLDFHSDKLDGALVWGYRWDGKRSTADMIYDIVKEDPRLYVLTGKAFGGYTAFGGFGYLLGDLEVHDKAEIVYNGAPLKQQADRVYVTEDLKAFDTAELSDKNAVWICGWGFESRGYWSFFTRINRLKPFSYSNVMADIDQLGDGSWSCFSFQEGWDSWTGIEPGDKFIPAQREK